MSSTAPKIEFAELNEDICEQIFYYFTIKERVDRELVCKDWCRILRRLWLTKQRVLSIQTRQGLIYNPNQLCNKKHHQLRDNDIVRPKWCPYLDGCLLDGLFSKACNLTTLVLGHSVGCYLQHYIGARTSYRFTRKQIKLFVE